MSRASVRRPVELHLLRFLPGHSPVHRMWPGTKLLVAAALGLSVGIFPTWPAAAAVAVLLGLAAATARVPAGALPRVPRWFVAGVAITAGLSLLSTAAPSARVAGMRLSLGGLEEWARFSVLGILVFVTALVVGWTTPMADLPPAVRSLLRPLRLVRLPVDELATAVALAVRCVPLLFEELATLAAARRARRRERSKARVDPVAALAQWARRAADDGVDLLVTATASSLRRAGELAEAMEARGGAGAGGGAPALVPVRLGWPDGAAVVLTVAAVVVMVLS